jgi:superfamily II RNA helicase
VKESFKLDVKELFPFKLDKFQHQAIAALDRGESVVVCAPTGSGKTLIGEYAVYRALSKQKRVFYTTPLKALSNQKFRDFQQQFGDSPLDVGLITGDILINPGASVVIMTTEIFRNMLYETPIGKVGTSLEDVDAVILDECHYISDRSRGTVWEESIIYCPPSIQLVALSATIGNPQELTDWINKVHYAANSDNQGRCKLINSNYRPVPLRFYFSGIKNLFPLLNQKQTKLNPKLATKSGKKGSRGKYKRKDCPTPLTVIKQLQEKDMLPVIYIIFSRRGCDNAVEKLEDLTLVTEAESKTIQLILLQNFLLNNDPLKGKILHLLKDYPEIYEKIVQYFSESPNAEENLLNFLNQNPAFQKELFAFIEANSESVRNGQLEPLLRGIGVHHAGLLPAWKELIEQLFEAGVVKVVFATSTLSAGINMPARTTVISALSRRIASGHQMLTPSEFLQIAGRAGRRGLDQVGHVVTVQTPFEGAKEAAYLATANPEPLKSCFAPSYGMVLNLLQKHTITEVKELLERSFAEYLAQKRLKPTQQAIAQMTQDLTKLDVELAGIDNKLFDQYEKLNSILKEEKRLLDILQQQANTERKKAIAPILSELLVGAIIHLKGKHLRVKDPIIAILASKIPGSGQLPNFLCLGEDNRWYIVTNTDIFDINYGFFPTDELESINLPELDPNRLGKGPKGDEITAKIVAQLPNYTLPLDEAPEVLAQQKKVNKVEKKLDKHPLNELDNPTHIIKRHKHRTKLRRELYKHEAIYRKHESSRSYYWHDFLNLIEVLREFKALEEYHPTFLGEVSAVIRGENELWLGLALISGKLDNLAPHHFAAAMSALITETPRPDSWTDYQQTPEVLAAFGFTTSEDNPIEAASISLREIRRQLIQTQNEYGLTIPVWLECKFIGCIENWALGVSWQELCENTSLDEGDLVRILRRTVDVLWQIPQIPGLTEDLKDKAREAIALIKRFPVL